MQERGAAPTLSTSGRARSTPERRLLLAAAVAASVVLVDQLTKSWAVHRLTRGPVHVIWRLDFVLAYNTGGSFSLARGSAPVITVVASLLVVGLVVAVWRSRRTLTTVALGLVIGGALGNLSDRLLRAHHGAVVDFIALHFWPTFNVADSCVVVGAILVVLSVWRAAEDKPASSDPAPDDQTEAA